jgi:four helix bundle protein
MPAINSFRDLEVWRLSIDLVEHCYGVVKSLPASDRFTFGNQIIRAAVSIPANIAEGTRRPTRAYLNHVSIALGSQAELETHLEIVRRLKLTSAAQLSDADALARTVGRLLNGLHASLERRSDQTDP